MNCGSLFANDVLAVHSSLTDSLSNDSHLSPLGSSYPTLMHLSLFTRWDVSSQSERKQSLG